MNGTKVWAHRGASAYAPENTMPAFALAAEMGADGIEIDIHLTADGELVICHDERLERVSDGAGYVYEKTLEQLRRLNFGYFHPDYGHTGIVTLGEFYAFTEKKGLFVNTELKYADTRWDEANQRAVAIAREYHMTQRVFYSSFQPEPLMKIKEIEPDAKVGLLYKDQICQPWKMAKCLGADALHPYYPRIYEQNMVRRCHELGVLLHPWIVDEPEELCTLFRCGVDAVITNKPDVALAVRRELFGE